jgi:hypothetical protein
VYEPLPLNEFAGQFVQLVAPLPLYLPEGQLKHELPDAY